MKQNIIKLIFKIHSLSVNKKHIFDTHGKIKETNTFFEC